MTTKPKVFIYTDGASLGNPGPSGWAAVLVFSRESNDYAKCFHGSIVGHATNQQAELQAAIEGFKKLKASCDVTVTTDSAYLRNIFDKNWIGTWKRNGWKTADGKAVKNQTQIKELDELVSQHEVEWLWVKGHDGDKFNEMADYWAGIGARDARDTLAGVGTPQFQEVV